MKKKLTKFNNLSHRDLCVKAAKYLRYTGIHSFHKCQYVVCELDRVGECPDAFGISSRSTQLIEVKMSRSDFLVDKKKYWRKYPELGLGEFRSYMCPIGIIKENDLPEKWGLLYVSNEGKITIIKNPEIQSNNYKEERCILLSLLRREGIMPRVFSYRKYKIDIVS